MFCFNCGKEILDDAKFCPFCGSKVYKEIEIVQNETKQSKANSNSGCFPIGCGLLILIVLMISLLNSMGGSNDDFIPENPGYSTSEIKGFYGACNYLDDLGLYTNGYKYIDEFGYGCNSQYKMLDNKSNIAFYVDGEKNNISKVYLVLNVYNTSNKQTMLNQMLITAEKLANKATGLSLTNEIRNSILNHRVGSFSLGSNTLKLELNKWSTGLGFDYKFTITK